MVAAGFDAGIHLGESIQRDMVAVPAAGPGDRLLSATSTDDRDPHRYASTPSKLSFACASSTSSG